MHTPEFQQHGARHICKPESLRGGSHKGLQGRGREQQSVAMPGPLVSPCKTLAHIPCPQIRDASAVSQSLFHAAGHCGSVLLSPLLLLMGLQRVLTEPCAIVAIWTAAPFSAHKAFVFF